MQLLNVACGGTLDQHLADAELHLHTPGTFCDHAVRLEPGSLAARAVGAERATVRSHHHQGVGRLGDGLVASGWADPGEAIEAIEAPDRALGARDPLAHRGGARSPVLAALVEAARRSSRVARRGSGRDRGRRAGDRAGDGRGPARRGRGDRRRGRRREGRLPGLARGRAGRPGAADAARSRRRSPTELEELAMLEARNAGKPIGDARGEIGMVAECFRYYAGAPGAAARQDDPGRGRGRHDLPRAARRRRPDHALELPARDRLVEGRAGARRRQHRRAQAGRADPADGARAGADRARGRAARGRAQRRRRAGIGLPASAWSSTPTSPRSRSPARPRSAAGSPPAPPQTIKRVTLELGGKSANVIFADADLDAAAAAPRRRRCSATRARTAARARGSWSSARRWTSSWRHSSAPVTSIVVGDPLDERTEMGPLISADQRETVELVRRRRRPGRDPRLGARRPRLLVRADGAGAGLELATAPRPRRSSARSPA